MTSERKQHLETIAASLTQSYYLVHTGGSPDYRDLLETYRFLLNALVEQDSLPAGHTGLRASDTLASFKADDANR
jgi:hypothetical protein